MLQNKVVKEYAPHYLNDTENVHNNLVKLAIFYNDFNSEDITEKPAYTVSQNKNNVYIMTLRFQLVSEKIGVLNSPEQQCFSFERCDKVMCLRINPDLVTLFCSNFLLVSI